MGKNYYEFKDKTSSKFWEIAVKGSTVTVRYGKIGTDGQTTVKKLGSPAAAAAHADKVTAEKVKKGYKKGKLSETNIEPIEKKSIEKILASLYEDNHNFFRKGCFQIPYKGKRFKVFQADGSYEGSFLTLIHYILYHEKLYSHYFPRKTVTLAGRVIENQPNLPPAFNDDKSMDLFDELVFDATEFTYQYMKDHKLYCEEMNKWIENVGCDWEPLKKVK